MLAAFQREFGRIWNNLLENSEMFFDLMAKNMLELAWHIIYAIIVLAIASLAVKLTSKATSKFIEGRLPSLAPEKAKRLNTVTTLFHSVARYAIYFIAIMLIFYEMGFGKALSGLFAGAGVGALAIGFGAQNLVKDVVTGLFMMFENQFSVGDYIKTNEAEGVVEATAMRVTYLRTLKGDQVIVPNGTIARVINYTRGGYVASVEVGTSYEDNTKEVMRVIQEAVNKYAEANLHKIEDMPNVLGISNFAASSVVIKVVCKAKSMLQWEVERDMRLVIKEAFEEHGFGFPYEHITVMEGKKCHYSQEQKEVLTDD